MEDVNRDNNMTKANEYYEYQIPTRPNFVVGTNFVASIVPATVKLANGTSSNVNWIQYKIPISSFTHHKDALMISNTCYELINTAHDLIKYWKRILANPELVLSTVDPWHSLS